MSVEYPYHALEDFLVANMSTVDAQAPDGWGSMYPVKGREIDATVLFADMTAFSTRTADLDPTETLAFVNHFFCWITAEALRGRPGIVDKYIGDEVMIVFSREFGSDDPFADAIQTARWMGQNDVYAFLPHVGLASGQVIVGYVGTPLKYSCSVFGAPVALASRCAGIKAEDSTPFSSSITFPDAEWGKRDLDAVFTGVEDRKRTRAEQGDHGWALLDPKTTSIKGLGDLDIRHIVRRAAWVPTQAPEDYAREIVQLIVKAGRRWDPQASTRVEADR